MPDLFWYPGHELLLTGIDRAEDGYLYGADGKRYVDLESGVWCLSVGHGHPRVLRTLMEQAARIAHNGFCYTSTVVAETAREILALLGFAGGRCVFLCSGSEAVEYGVRVVQLVNHRPRLLTLAGSYFGAYGSAMLKQEQEWFCHDWTPCASCPHAGACGEHCEHWADIPFADLGGFLLEPGSSPGTVHFPPEKLVQCLVAEIRARGGLVLVNEVTTGIGRTGAWFGFQHYGIEPDVVALGKGIGNGYPVSVAALASSVTDRLGDRPVPYAQSHQNDPVGAAVAREVLRIIRDEGLIERGRNLGAVLLAGLAGVQARTGRIVEIRGRGLMVAVELRDDADASLTVRAHPELVHRGYIVGRRPGVPVLRLDPSLTVAQEDLEGFVRALEDVLGQ